MFRRQALKKKHESVSELIRTGKLTPNEARVELGLTPLPDPAADLKMVLQSALKIIGSD